MLKVLDQWHPLEKAQFPDYFNKRVELKKAYISWYAKKYGKTSYNPEIEGHIAVGSDGHDDHDDHSENLTDYMKQLAKEGPKL
jgi:hypothetical protein